MVRCEGALNHLTSKVSTVPDSLRSTESCAIEKASRLNSLGVFRRWSPPSYPLPALMMQPLLTPCQMVLTSALTPGPSLPRALFLIFFLFFFFFVALFFSLPLPLSSSSFLFFSRDSNALPRSMQERRAGAKQIWLSCLSPALQCQLGKTCSYGCCVERNESNYTDWQT